MWIDKIDPLRHVGAGHYLSFWDKMFSTILLGFWGRFFASALLILAFWFGVRRRNFGAAATCFVLSIMIAYGAVFLHFIGLL